MHALRERAVHWRAWRYPQSEKWEGKPRPLASLTKTRSSARARRPRAAPEAVRTVRTAPRTAAGSREWRRQWREAPPAPSRRQCFRANGKVAKVAVCFPLMFSFPRIVFTAWWSFAKLDAFLPVMTMERGAAKACFHPLMTALPGSAVQLVLARRAAGPPRERRAPPKGQKVKRVKISKEFKKKRRIIFFSDQE